MKQILKIVAAATLILNSPFSILNSSAQTALTLEQCIALARQNNRTLQRARLEIEAANAQRKEAKTNYLPQISANVIAFQAFDKMLKADGTLPQELAALASIDPALGQLAGQPFSIGELNRGLTASLSVMQPLYAGGQIRTGNQLAAVGQEVAHLQQLMQEKEVVQQVTENYWQVARVHYQLQTIAAAQRQLDSTMQQVQAFVDAGVTTQNALLRVRLRQSELESTRLELANAEAILTLLLAQQIGLGSEAPALQFPDQDANVALPPLADVAHAATGREEYQLAVQNVAAQRLQVKMERANALPTLAAGVVGYHYSLGGLSSGLKQYYDGRQTSGLALATLSVPLSAWNGTSHAIKRQKVRLEQARLEQQDAAEQLRIDILSAWNNLALAQKQVEVARTAVADADENWRMMQDQYQVGSAVLTDLLDAETLQREARSNLSAALADFHTRLSDYQRKVGVE